MRLWDSDTEKVFVLAAASHQYFQEAELGIHGVFQVPNHQNGQQEKSDKQRPSPEPDSGGYSTEESLHKSARRNTAKESPYIDTEVIQSVDRENYKDSDFKALMKKIRRTRFLNKSPLS